MSYIKSPLNYTGGKFKLLPQLIPLFPKEVNNFIDLFGGGANVSVNVEANKIYYNDLIEPVVKFLEHCKNIDLEYLLKEIDRLILWYELSKENEAGYKKLRSYYNDNGSDTKTPMMFFMLVCHSFNNQIRFNRSGKFNLPFGKRCLSPELKQKFIDFVNELKRKNIVFVNRDFRNLHLHNIKTNDFVYCDPPYLISCATYNESDGWNEECEKDLLNILDNVNRMGSKFALSNVLESKGKENLILKEWSKKYNVHKLKKDYKNSNHQRVKDDVTTEVLITNY